MRFICGLLVLLFILSGCSKGYLLARWHLIQAEDAFAKAYALRVKEESSEERMEYYRKAREHFLNAYEYDKGAFTLNVINAAADTCLRLEDQAGVKLFQEFAEEYTAAHPKEAEYGDAAAVFGVE